MGLIQGCGGEGVIHKHSSDILEGYTSILNVKSLLRYVDILVIYTSVYPTCWGNFKVQVSKRRIGVPVFPNLLLIINVIDILMKQFK